MNQLESWTGANSAKKAIKTAIEAINTINDGLNIYNKELDQIVPWNSFKKSSHDLSKFSAEYSLESADLVGKIKTQLMNITDVYYSATQKMYEWCDASKQIFEAYINLFDNGDATKQMIQKKGLVQRLETQKQAIEHGQIQLDDCAEYLNKTSQHLIALKFHLNKDYDENGEYFQRKLQRILSDSHDSADKSCQWFLCWSNKSTDIAATEEKRIRELKEKLKIVREFYENLKTQIDQACIDVKQIREKLNDKMQEIDRQKARIGETKTYSIVGDISELRNCAVEAANNLITDCDEYRNNHEN